VTTSGTAGAGTTGAREGARDRMHRYNTALEWTGSTADGYAHYTREHRVFAAGVDGDVRLSADPQFRGDAALLNPETLLVMSASSCQMLSFLAEATRVGLDVVSYTDSAVGEMPHESPMWVQRIALKPLIRLRGDYDEAMVLQLVERAHEACFIANSVRTAITIEATILSAS
jgi:organic hydroperoxide reductase OsmC/OhrA